MSKIPVFERPREKLFSKGVSSLKDDELLAVLLGSGTPGTGVMQLSFQVLRLIDTKNGNLQAKDLNSLRGIGRAKAAIILAAIEFSRRRIRPGGTIIRQSADVIDLVRHLASRKQEHLICISLNGAHEVIASRIVTVGLVNQAQVHAREIFSDPIVDRACSIILAHNHPSGSVEPSEDDIATTKRIAQTGTLLGIPLLDHIVFSERGYFSFQERMPDALNNCSG